MAKRRGEETSTHAVYNVLMAYITGCTCGFRMSEVEEDDEFKRAIAFISENSQI